MHGEDLQVAADTASFARKCICIRWVWGNKINEKALKALVRAAVTENTGR
jgi:hypothetical protein